MNTIPAIDEEKAKYIANLLNMDVTMKKDGTFNFKMDNNVDLLKAVIMLALKCFELDQENNKIRKDYKYESDERWRLSGRITDIENEVRGDGK